MQQDRAIRQTQGQPEQALGASDSSDSGKNAPPAGNGQGAADGGTRYGGYGGSGNDSLPSPLGGNVNRPPAYPELARQRGQEGQVVLLVHVDMRGNPTKVLVEASSEHALLDQAAVRAIRRWKFNPASRNGEAVPGTVRVPVTFRLQ
jgi:protein TonB